MGIWSSSIWVSPGTGMYFIYMTLSVLASYRKTLSQADDVKWPDQSELWNPMIAMSFFIELHNPLRNVFQILAILSTWLGLYSIYMQTTNDIGKTESVFFPHNLHKGEISCLYLFSRLGLKPSISFLRLSLGSQSSTSSSSCNLQCILQGY